MIPKQLFFIWFGDNKPDYIDYSIKSFKDMNNDFNVDFIHYTMDDVLHCDDSVLKYCKDLIFQTKNGIRNKYFDYIKKRIESKFNFIQILSDFLRFELLYYYGGIYLDCDTFPVKKFDEKLLSQNSFSQNVLCMRNKKYKPENLHDDLTSYYDLNFSNDITKYHCYTYTDIYFVGLKKEYTENEIVFTSGADNKNPLNPPWIRNFDNSPQFKKLREKFLRKQLVLYKDILFYSQYIMHFPGRGWQKDYKTNCLYCEYDDYLYGDK